MTDAQLRALDALGAITPDLPRFEWVRVGMAFHAVGGAFEDFDSWSSGGSSYNARACRDTWRSFRAGRGIGPGTLFAIAREHGWSGSPSRQPRERRAAAPARPAARPKPAAPPEGLSSFARALWARCEPLAHTTGTAYLAARGCALPPADGDLRFHPSLAHPSGACGPALVALVTGILSREPQSLHFTWIREDGTKADLDPPRMLLAGHRKSGGCIRLWPDEAVTTGLGIAEGVESALSLAHAFRPAWSLVDAGNLGQFPVLEGVESLTVAADHDDAGERAARACAERWADAGREVRLVLPPRAGTDLNDIAREVA